MRFKNPFALNRSFSILLQNETAGGEMPYAARISLQRLTGYVLGFALVLATLFCGTLLFLRELELNRELQEHVLRLESDRRLLKDYPLPDRELAARQPSAAVAPAPAVPIAPPVTPEAPAAPELTASAEADYGRLTDLRSECTEEDCTIRINMINKRSTPAQGSLLLVLETEVPRIGGAAPNAPVRTRYLLYPGSQTRDALDPNELAGLEHRTFRITKALATSATFKVGKLLRPLAINAYVFDSNKTLLQHERRVIEGETVR